MCHLHNERGKYLPDISLFKPLSEILNVSINDLMSGEIINKNDYQEKTETNILNTIEYTEKKVKKSTKIFKILITSLVTLIIILIIMFSIDVSKMNQNKPVIFSTWGYSYAPAIDLHEKEIEQAIKNYLTEKGDNELGHYNNEKTFVSFRIYLIEELKRNEKFNIYAWVKDGKFYLENNEIKQNSASSIPYKFVIKKVNDIYIVTDSKIPRDGSYYPSDMKKIFPKSVRNEMERIQTDGTLERLEKELKEQAKLYYYK